MRMTNGLGAVLCAATLGMVGMAASTAAGAPGDVLATLAPPPGDAEVFGASVSVDGTTLLVGATSGDGAAVNSGVAYLYDISDPTNPVFLHRLEASDGASPSSFGAAVSVRGNLAVVGASQADGLKGAAYLFDVTTGNELAKIFAPDGEMFDSFGSSLATDGVTVVVGSPFDSGVDGLATGFQGTVHVFDATTPTSPAYVRIMKSPDNSTGNSDGLFGLSVAIEGDSLVIGMPGYNTDSVTRRTGAVYITSLSTGAFEHTQFPRFINDGGGDFFGESVAVFGGRVVCGASGDDDAGAGAGEAQVMDIAGQTIVAQFEPIESQASDFIGRRVAFDGDVALVSAFGDDDAGPNAGAVYVIDSRVGTAVRNLKLLPPDPSAVGFGSGGVATNGSVAIIGQVQAGEGGEVHIFSLDDAPAGCNDADFDNNGALNIDDIDAFVAEFLGGCP